jgi:hypothetical protein
MSTEICMACLVVLLLAGAALARYAWVHWIMTDEEILAEYRRMKGDPRRW